MTDITIDVGGTKTLVAAFRDCEDRPLRSEKFPTDANRGPELFLDGLRRTCEGILNGDQVRCWGLCTAGAVDSTNGVLLRSPNLGWMNVNLYDPLARQFGRNGIVENDCNAAAYGEWFVRGDIDSLVYVTVSTGIGMGIVANGELIRGAHRAAGEVGHTITVPGGPLCACGRKGCLQAVAGGNGLAEQIKEITGEEITAKVILGRAALGQSPFAETVSSAARVLGRFLGNVIDTIDPEVLVIGGSLGKNAYYFEQVVAALHENYYRLPGKRAKVEMSRVEPNGGIMGMLFLARTRVSRTEPGFGE